MSLKTATNMSKELVCTGFIIIITIHSGPVAGGIYPLLRELAVIITSRTALRFINQEFDTEEEIANQMKSPDLTKKSKPKK